MGMSEDTEVYRKHRDELLRYATSLVGASNSEDIVATIILRTIRRRPLSELENPRSYLMKAVLNEARSVLRRQAADPLPASLVESLSPEVAETIDAIRKLPMRQRAAVFLFYWEDRPVQEIATLMGVRPGTVKRYLHNARRRLKGDLE